jgi:hypothetical protein
MIKKIIFLFCLSIYFLVSSAQIKELKLNGFSINVYGRNGNRTGGYTIQNQHEEYLGHNTFFFIIRRLNSIIVFDEKGHEHSTRSISIANRDFLKITEKSIWIKEGAIIHYYDFLGNRLSNYKE